MFIMEQYYANLEQYIFGNGCYAGLSSITGCAGPINKELTWFDFVDEVVAYLDGEYDQAAVKYLWDELGPLVDGGYEALKPLYQMYLDEMEDAE